MDEKNNEYPEYNPFGTDNSGEKPQEVNDTPWYQQGTSFSSQEHSEPVQEKKEEPESGYSPYSQDRAQSEYHYSYQQPQQTYQQQTYQPPQPPEEKKPKKTGKKVFAAVLAVIIIFCGIFGALSFKDRGTSSEKSTEKKEGDAQLQIDDTAAESAETNGESLSAQSIYKKIKASSVGVILYATGSSLFSSNSTTASKSNIAGEGTGVVMSLNGDKTKTYIITCAHVISSAKASGYKVVVQDCEGEQYDATVVGYDSKTDLGVLSVESSSLSPAQFGDSSKLEIGDTVYAIGNPGGTEFFGSFTRGMVSAIDRSVSNEIGYDMKCIQHDAAINPGNSGGALVNSAGQVIGINSSKIASTEYEGMGFSIPISSAKPIIDDIIANGYVTNRPKLGIKYLPASSYQQYAMVVQIKGLPSGSLIIAEISQNSAFKGTKAEVGDLITAVNGEEMTSADVLLDKIENGKVGDKLKLTLCRINQNYEISEFDVTVTLIEDDGKTEETTTTAQVFDWNQFFGY